jgi:DeoR family transcriptional regulator, fructose operon transcriptional repressor
MAVAAGSVATAVRLRWLTERLDTNGSVTIAEAAAVLGVSEMTIRRDITELEERGAVRRVRGGALAVGPRTFAERRSINPRAKGRIAAKLATLVPHTGAVAFDASSTVLRVVPLLSRARDLVAVTNGPDTFAALQHQRGIAPVLTGGQLDGRTGSLVGGIACRTARQITAKLFVASAAAVDDQVGATEATIEEAEVKRAFAEAASRVVLAVDSSKLTSRAISVGLEWEHVDVLVTELHPEDERLTGYRVLAEVH